MDDAAPAQREEEIFPTPAFVILATVMHENCRLIAAKCRSAGLALRPHVKTTKLVEVGRAQTEHGPWPVDPETHAGAGEPDAVDAAAEAAGSRRPAVVVSTMAEAEAFASRGFRDITFAVPLNVAPTSLSRVLGLHGEVPRLRLMVDCEGHVEALEAAVRAAAEDGTMAAHAEGDGPAVDAAALLGSATKRSKPSGAAPSLRRVSVFVALDCGYGREGIDVTDEAGVAAAVALCGRVHASPALALAGLYSHSGNSYNTEGGAASAAAVALEEARLAGAAAAAVRASGVPVSVVSVGSTPSVCAPESLAPLRAAGATEVHPGNYVLLDRQQLVSGSATDDAASASASSSSSSPSLRVACHVVASVIGVYPKRNEVLINAGGTALHKDSGGDGVTHWGSVRGTGGRVVAVRLSQEHGVLTTADGSSMPWSDFPLGAAVRVVPNHSCMAACMHDVHHVVDGAGRVVDVWRPARGW